MCVWICVCSVSDGWQGRYISKTKQKHQLTVGIASFFHCVLGVTARALSEGESGEAILISPWQNDQTNKQCYTVFSDRRTISLAFYLINQPIEPSVSLPD